MSAAGAVVVHRELRMKRDFSYFSLEINNSNLPAVDITNVCAIMLPPPGPPTTTVAPGVVGVPGVSGCCCCC